MLHSILHGRLRFSLRKLMLLFTALVFVVASATAYLRMIANRPNLTYEIVVGFNTTCSRPAVKDIVLKISQNVGDPSLNDLSVISEQIGNGNLRISSYGDYSYQIVAAGKSWKTTSEKVESIARATADAIISQANHEGIAASIVFEMKTRSLSRIPEASLAELDRTKD